MLRTGVSLCLLLSVAACGDQLRPAEEVSRAGCYTVEIYDDAYGRNVVQPPKEGLPAAWNRYLGVWGNGAWNGGQCHEIHVTEIFQDGSVVVIDTVAPFGELRATSHRRTGYIDANNDLVLPIGGRRVVYTFEGDSLRALRYRSAGRVDQAVLAPKT